MYIRAADIVFDIIDITVGNFIHIRMSCAVSMFSDLSGFTVVNILCFIVNSFVYIHMYITEKVLKI